MKSYIEKRTLLCYDKYTYKLFITHKEVLHISSYQRIIWFHNSIISNKYPNARKLAEQFEISLRQSQRDIEYLRDSMNAPLMYSGKERGYIYSEEYLLPSFFLSDSEKRIINTMIENYRRIGSFGYSEYRQQADLLSKISHDNAFNSSTHIKEPYIAEIQWVSDRISTVPLDSFAYQHKENNSVFYAFYDPDIFISVLICSNLDFKILKPKWLKERIKKRLNDICLLL